MEVKTTFKEKLKEIYSKQGKIAQLIEGLDKIPEQSMEDYYVKLQTIIKEDDEKKSGAYESISGEKKEIEIDHIFDQIEGVNDGKVPEKLLLLGGAGVGKSTLMQYIAHNWGTGKFWGDKFDYVYRVNLKTLLNNDWKEDYEAKERRDDLLKCLVHYSLTRNLTPEEEKELKLEDMPWPANNSKTLLLLDGYDEVAHLSTTKEYKKIDFAIFEHKNIIFTSRPNAVDKQMKNKFDRTIENTGLDNTGIEQYFSKYFKDDAEKKNALEKFLTDNPVIKEICKIPVNIGMLCYIWLEKDTDADLEISSVSDLYSEVIARLGHRYFAKEWKGEQKEGSTLEEKLKNGEFILDELKVLAHTAYKGMTGGGVEQDQERTKESLIIKGSIFGKPEDVDGISLQSSINYLASKREIKEDPGNKVTIREVYKYGVLKTEATSEASSDQGQEKDETQLQKQDYSFIHLTFQEYLSAYYLTKHLEQGSPTEQQQIRQYIEEHRNEPRYLMMLKFMAGIVTRAAGEAANNIAKMFWEAVTCNMDGVIELGVETKVELLMHLFSQAKKNGILDDRIPNKESITQLIDVVVLSDLSKWGDRLKATDYISENIKQALLEGFQTGDLGICNTKIAEIRDQSNPELQAAIEAITTTQKAEQELWERKENIQKSCATSISNLISKYEKNERQEIVKIYKLIIEKIYTNTINYAKNEQLQESYKSLKLMTQIIDSLTKITPYIKLSEEEKQELLTLLLEIAITGEDYRTSPLKCINYLFNTEDKINSSNISIIFEKFISKNFSKIDNITKVLLTIISENTDLSTELVIPFQFILQQLSDDDTLDDIIIQTKKEIVNFLPKIKLIANNQIKEILFQEFKKLLNDEIDSIREKSIIQLPAILSAIKNNDNNHIDTLFPILEKLCKDPYSAVRVNMARMITTIVQENIEKTLKIWNILHKDSDQSVRSQAVSAIPSIIEYIPTELETILNLLNEFTQDKEPLVRTQVAKILPVIIFNITNQEQITKLSNNLQTLCNDKSIMVRLVAQNALKTTHLQGLKNLTHTSNELILNTINQNEKELNLTQANDDESILGECIQILLKEDPSTKTTKAYNEILRIAPIICTNEETTIELFSKFKTLQKSERHLMQITAVVVLNKIISLSNRTLIQKLLPEIQALPPYPEIDITPITANLMLNSQDILEYLNHENKDLRDAVAKGMVKSFKGYLDKLALLEKLLQDKEKLNIEAITKELFTIELPKEGDSGDNKTQVTIADGIKIQIEEELATITASKEKDVTKLKKVLLPALNRMGDVQAHELIEYMLAIIGDEDVTNLDKNRKKLFELAQEILNVQVDHLSPEGLEWINDNFDLLSGLSSKSKVFFAKIYHQILQHFDINTITKELIIKFINHGMTTSLTKAGEISFEGKKYTLKGEHINLIVEEIAQNVIDQRNDILGEQYRTHKPLFKNSESSMKEATTDKNSEIFSLVDSTRKLSNAEWFCTDLNLNGTKILLLEMHSSMGDHLVYYNKSADSDENSELEFTRIDGNGNHKELREKIFGKYGLFPLGKVHYGQSINLSFKQVEAIVKNKDNQNAEYVFKDKAANAEKQEYFHDELLQSKLVRGINDRTSYKLNKKLDDKGKILDNELARINLPEEQKEKIKDYYKAFIKTIEQAYNIAETTQSGEIVLKIFNPGTRVLSAGVSVLPCIGPILSNAIDGTERVIETTERRYIATNTMKIADNSIQLHQKISELIIQIILDEQKGKKTQIIFLTEEDKMLFPDGTIRKVKKLAEILKEGYNNALYGQLYNTPAGLLGHQDAMAFLEKWLEESDNRNFDRETTLNKIKEQIIVGASSYVPQIIEDKMVDTIDKLKEYAVKGDWSNILFSLYRNFVSIIPDAGIEVLDNKYNYCDKLFNADYLIKQLQIIKFDHGPKEINNVRIILFKNMCNVIASSDEKNMKCIKGFAEEYPELIKTIAEKHPEYFVSANIAKAAIKNQELLNKVIEKLNDNPTGNGAEDYEETSFWYEYSKAAMKQLLELRLISADMESEASVIHPNYIFSETTKLAFTQDLVSQIASIADISPGSKILIPINIDNQHWVGMSMEFTVDDKILINYMDSEGEVIPASLRINIEQQLSETFPSASIEISEKEVEQQKYNNCGLEVIENLIDAVAGEAARMSQEDALAVHSVLYEDSLINEFVTKEAKSEQKTMKIAWKEVQNQQIIERAEEILLEETNSDYISTASKPQHPAPVLSSTETVKNLLETLIRFISREALPGGKSLTDGITTMQSVPDISVPTPIIAETNLVFDDLT